VPIDQIARIGTLGVIAHGAIDTLPDEPDPSTATVVSTGPAVQGTCITLTDDDGNVISESDRCGEIVVHGRSVSAGYLRADGTLEPHGDAGFRTGDIGFFHGGDLYIVERTKNTIIRNGHNYSATVLERELARVLERPLNEVLVVDSDLRPGLGRVTAVIGVDRGEDLTAIRDLVSFASRAIEPTLEQLLIVPRGALPRTTSGKKQHHRVRSMIQLDEFERMTRFDLLPTVEPVVVDEILDLDAIDARYLVLRLVTEHARLRGVARPVDETTDLVTDLGFDSLAMYELAVTIEGQLAIGVPDEALAEVRRVSDLLELVEACRRGDMDVTVNVSDRIAAIAESLPQTYLAVRAQKVRQLLIGDRWITDFASLNYLGLDLDPRVIRSVQPALEEWGVHPGWTRAVASPAPYRELEDGLAKLVNAPGVVVFPTITLLHFGVLPKLAGSTGTILIDQGSHSSILEAAELARSRGATLVPVRRSDPDDLEAKLRTARPDGPRVVTTNGVYSMTGNIPDLRAYADLAERYDATLYVDDAHGIGVLGAHPDDQLAYGHGGGGVVQHLGLSYDRIVYIGGLSKAFSSMAAFVTCRNDTERSRIETASTMLFSGPIPVASLASALAGVRINELDGDQLRARIWRLTTRLIAGARDLGFVIDNDTGFPCVTPIVGGLDETARACQVLWDQGVLITPAVFPAMPLERGGVRISVTAANTDSEIEQLLTALEAVRDEIGISPDVAMASARAGLFEY
jgi:acyl carrier protein